MHPDNKHQNAYDFKQLIKVHPPLKNYVLTIAYGRLSIDFSKSQAVKALNTALLKSTYGVQYWDIPAQNLCPPIPGRADYILYLNDLINKHQLTQKPVKILDIGTGANLIYPILGCKIFDWQFIATDIDPKSLDNAKKIIRKNNLEHCIKLKRQVNPKNILKGVIEKQEHFTASMCNPPFFDSLEAAQKANRRKNRHLKHPIRQRNFQGIANELWIEGGELSFIKKYMNESLQYSRQIKLFTTLVSNKKHLALLIRYLKRKKVNKYEVIPMQQGQKTMHILVWNFVKK